MSLERHSAFSQVASISAREPAKASSQRGDLNKLLQQVVAQSHEAVSEGTYLRSTYSVKTEQRVALWEAEWKRFLAEKKIRSSTKPDVETVKQFFDEMLFRPNNKRDGLGLSPATMRSTLWNRRKSIFPRLYRQAFQPGRAQADFWCEIVRHVL